MGETLAVVGGGLAGAECAWRAAEAGVPATIFEMRPEVSSPAHTGAGLAELVCSNSFRSTEPHSAIGILKDEMRSLGSLVMRAAEATAVPAGKALAVDRDRFSELVTRLIEEHPLIRLERREIRSLDDPALAGFSAVAVCAGPLASDALAASLMEAVGEQQLYFYDAIAPIVAAESVDMSVAFWGSRWRPEEKDYLNCPMSEEDYRRFHAELLAAEKVPCREFEKEVHFEGCLPIEELAERGEMTLAFGPLKPVGLDDPRTGRRPFGVVQLRAENLEKKAFNLVGFQTKLKYPEQERIFRMIPGLEKVEFLRMGSIHRNTFVNAPKALTDRLELKGRPGTYLGGQIAGVEGYLESAACGLWLGCSLAAKLSSGAELSLPPVETAMGALLGHLRTEAKNFQPSNVNFGLMPEVKVRGGKKRRQEVYAGRAREAFSNWLKEIGRE